MSHADRATLIAAVKAHFDDAHPEFGVNEIDVANYLDAEDRLTGSTERLDAIGSVAIVDLTPDRLDDVLEFFDCRAFADNPAWAACYCVFHHIGGRGSVEWPTRTWRQNRAELAERIGNGSTTGALAYVDGVLAGWCNASARSAFPEHSGQEAPPDAEVGGIVCFVVAPPYRKHRLMPRLLDAACEMLARRGFAYAEGYPVEQVDWDPVAYHGTRPLFAAAGFEPVGGGAAYRKHLG